jgi:ribosomal protein L11 methyltransferase
LNYIELKCRRPDSLEQTEMLVAELAEIGFESFSEDENYLLAYIPQNDFATSNLLSTTFCKNLDNRTMLAISIIKSQNWNAVWESNYTPVTIDGCCQVRATFHEAKPELEYDILLNPKMAFGTAHHETTALMIRLLLKENVEGIRVLDMGCGTGVLGILAVKKGALMVTAIDTDEWAYNNTLENIELNNLTGFTVLKGGAELLEGDDNYDLILANINKNILVSDMHAYAKVLRKGGRIFFSGFYTEDLEDITKNAKKCGLIFESNLTEKNWVAAIFHKK